MSTWWLLDVVVMEGVVLQCNIRASCSSGNIRLTLSGTCFVVFLWMAFSALEWQILCERVSVDNFLLFFSSSFIRRRRFSDFRDPFDADSTQIRIGFDAKSLG